MNERPPHLARLEPQGHDLCPHCHGRIIEEREGPNLIAPETCEDCGAQANYDDCLGALHDLEIHTGYLFGEHFYPEASMAHPLTEEEGSWVDRKREVWGRHRSTRMDAQAVRDARSAAVKAYHDEALF